MKHKIDLYYWDPSREQWVFIGEGWIDPREIQGIKWNAGYCPTFGDISAVTIFQTPDYRYVTCYMSRSSANYLNNLR